MDIGQWRKDHPGLIAAGAAVLLIIAIVTLLINFGLFASPPQAGVPGQKLYYYDLNKKALIAAPDMAPPVPTESGDFEGKPAGVRAFVYSCGDCSDAANRFIGYLETLESGFREQLDPTQAQGWYLGTSPVTLPGMDEAVMVKRESESTWVSKDSSTAQDIVESVEKKCSAEQTLTECFPAP